MSIRLYVTMVTTVHRFIEDCRYRRDLVYVKNGKLSPLTSYYVKRWEVIRESSFYTAILNTNGVLRDSVLVYKESGMESVSIDSLSRGIGSDICNSWIDRTAMIFNTREIRAPRGKSSVILNEYADYLDVCLNGRDKVHVVRIDFKYRESSECDLSRVKEDFRRWSKKQYGCKDSDVLAYIWSMEQGDRCSRWHIHSLVFLEYSEDESTIESYVKRMTVDWSTATGGDGIVYCQYSGRRLDDRGGYPCTGVVDLKSDIALVGLSYILMYFFKDHGSRDSGGKGPRLVGRGQLPSDVKDV